MIILAGSASPSVDVFLCDNTGLPLTGKTYSDFPTTYYRIAGANSKVAMTLQDRAAETTAWAQGGVKELGGGWYRLDLYAAAVATAGTLVTVFGYDASGAGKNVICTPLEVTPGIDLQLWRGSQPSVVSGGLIQTTVNGMAGNIITNAQIHQSALPLLSPVLLFLTITSPTGYVSVGTYGPHTSSPQVNGRPAWISTATGVGTVWWNGSKYVLSQAVSVNGTNWMTADDIFGTWTLAGGSAFGTPTFTSLRGPKYFELLAIDSTTGRVLADLRAILGAAITGTAANIAAAFSYMYDVVTARFTAASYTQGADSNTILSALDSRLTSARAGYLDNLNIGGAVASHADVLNINTSTSKHILLQTVGQYERPESGSVSYTIEARTFRQSDGAAVNADSTPTLTATGKVSGSLAANLAAATNPATGIYRWEYTVSSAATLEQIRFDVTATISTAAYDLSCYTQIADFVAATWNTSDRANLTAIYNKLPSHNIADETTAAANVTTISSAIGELPTAAGFWSILTANIATAGSIGLSLKSFLAEYVMGPTASDVAHQVANVLFVDGTDHKLKINSDQTASSTVAGGVSVDLSGLPPIAITIPAAVAVASQESNVITCLRGDTLQVSLPLLGNLVGRTKLSLTAKSNLIDTDDAAVIQIAEEGGLVRFNGSEPINHNEASLTVHDATMGVVDLRIDATATALLAIQDLVWDVQVCRPSSVVSPISGVLSVVADVTRAID